MEMEEIEEVVSNVESEASDLVDKETRGDKSLKIVGYKGG